MAALEWMSNNPWLALLGALGSIASIWGLVLALRGSGPVQKVSAGGSIRKTDIRAHAPDPVEQQVTAGKDIVDSRIEQTSESDQR